MNQHDKAPKMPAWNSPDGLRIWRAGALPNSYGNEALEADKTMTSDKLAAIAAGGFNAIWIFCRLYELMESTIFPELNEPLRGERIASLRRVVTRAREHGLGVFLYFNEPAAVRKEHPFWVHHEHLRGVERWGRNALCTSVPDVQAFQREALASVFQRLTGVAGVILITGSEDHTHCWSKISRAQADQMSCPRCREREPAELVLDHIGLWSEVSREQREPFRILAWNWEWNLWYPDPPAAIIDHLPENVELLLDMEFGGSKPFAGRQIHIGEYALSYAGPCERLVQSRAIAGARQVHAKLQLNTTHELCTVPNLPVLATLHRKLVALGDQQLNGFMGCWTIGCALTLNTRAVQLFAEDPARYRDLDLFLDAVARREFGVSDSGPLRLAWEQFSEAFLGLPFEVPLLYSGPHNDAPARPLTLHVAGTRSGRSFMPDPIGDDLSGCLQSLTLDEVVKAYGRVSRDWEQGLEPYSVISGHPEYGVARMVAIQLHSLWNVWRFYREQQRILARDGLTPPCDLPPDPALLAIIRDELANAAQTLPLVEADSRLGFHEEYQGYKYDAPSIRSKLRQMAACLPSSGTQR